jgi:hypothetical protein
MRGNGGCPRLGRLTSVRRYIEGFGAGRQQTEFTAHLRKELGPKELARLHGTWYMLVRARD